MDVFLVNVCQKKKNDNNNYTCNGNYIAWINFKVKFFEIEKKYHEWINVYIYVPDWPDSIFCIKNYNLLITTYLYFLKI